MRCTPCAARTSKLPVEPSASGSKIKRLADPDVLGSLIGRAEQAESSISSAKVAAATAMGREGFMACGLSGRLRFQQ